MEYQVIYIGEDVVGTNWLPCANSVKALLYSGISSSLHNVNKLIDNPIKYKLLEK